MRTARVVKCCMGDLSRGVVMPPSLPHRDRHVLGAVVDISFHFVEQTSDHKAANRALTVPR